MSDDEWKVYQDKYPEEDLPSLEDCLRDDFFDLPNKSRNTQDPTNKEDWLSPLESLNTPTQSPKPRSNPKTWDVMLELADRLQEKVNLQEKHSNTVITRPPNSQLSEDDESPSMSKEMQNTSQNTRTTTSLIHWKNVYVFDLSEKKPITKTKTAKTKTPTTDSQSDDDDQDNPKRIPLRGLWFKPSDLTPKHAGTTTPPTDQEQDETDALKEDQEGPYEQLKTLGEAYPIVTDHQNDGIDNDTEGNIRLNQISDHSTTTPTAHCRTNEDPSTRVNRTSVHPTAAPEDRDTSKEPPLGPNTPKDQNNPPLTPLSDRTTYDYQRQSSIHT